MPPRRTRRLPNTGFEDPDAYWSPVSEGEAEVPVRKQRKPLARKLVVDSGSEQGEEDEDEPHIKTSASAAAPAVSPAEGRRPRRQRKAARPWWDGGAALADEEDAAQDHSTGTSPQKDPVITGTRVRRRASTGAGKRAPAGKRRRAVPATVPSKPKETVVRRRGGSAEAKAVADDTEDGNDDDDDPKDDGDHPGENGNGDDHPGENGYGDGVTAQEARADSDSADASPPSPASIGVDGERYVEAVSGKFVVDAEESKEHVLVLRAEAARQARSRRPPSRKAQRLQTMTRLQAEGMATVPGTAAGQQRWEEQRVVRYASDIRPTEMGRTAEAADVGFVVRPAFDRNRIVAGTLHIAPGFKKPLERASDFLELFTVVGCEARALVVTIQDVEFRLAKADSILVPPRCCFSMHNTSQTVEACLTFTVVRRMGAEDVALSAGRP